MKKHIESSSTEIKKLKDKIFELEQFVNSIQGGEIDALIINNKKDDPSIFTLEGADQPYRILVENLSEGALTLARDGKIIHCNKQFSKMIKIPQQTLINSSLFEYIPDTQHNTLRILLNNTKVETYKREFTLLAADNTRKFILLSSHNFKFGNVNGLSLVATDISELKIEREERDKIGEELHIKKILFNQITENIKEVFWCVSPDLNQLTYISPAYEEVWGRPKDNLYSNPYEWLESVVEDDKEKVKQFIMTMREKPFASVEYRIVKPDGIEKVIFTKGFQVRDNSGKLINVIGIAADMTEFSELRSQAHLNDKLRTVGILAAGIVHDIKNPITWLLNNLEFIKNNAATLDPFKLKEMLNESIDAAERIQNIVQNLNGFSRVEDKNISTIDLHQLLESVIAIASREIKSHAKTVITYAKNIPFIEANSGKLRQVFLNLIINAAQAIPEGDVDNNIINITVTFVNPNVKIDISDTGCGISSENLPKIFDPFFTTKPVGKGTGLGLSIAYDIVKSLGGDITVKSTPGVGTTFSLYFPLSQSDKITSEQPPKKIEPLHSQAHKCILVVDDEPSLLKSIVRMLPDQHEVITASGGQMAIDLLQKNDKHYDVIITDLSMPTISGADLYHFVAKNFPGREKNIIFMTGGAYNEQLKTFMTSIKNPCLDKPFDKEKLLALIAACGA